MSLELSIDQRQAVDAEGTPLRLLDPRTGNMYVLVDETVFEKIQVLFSDDIADTYTAQVESAMRAGWDDLSWTSTTTMIGVASHEIH
jgi:hypothetical protein